MLATDIRARSLNDIIGQETVVKGLKNYLKNNNLPDIIYFIGNSGSGKTTLAYLTAMTLNCHNKKIEEDGTISPCLECPSCQDVISERFQRDIHVYNGGQLKAEGIEEIDSKLSFSAMNDENLIFILNEAQMISSIKKFLAMIEKPRKNVYFLLTSTDKDKFKNVSSSNNKDQETNALRSRGAFFNIKPVSTSDIMDYLFSLLEKLELIDKVSESFIDEGLSLIAQNSKGNVRMAVNDFSQCVNSEAFSTKEILELLDYEDELQNINILYLLALRKKEALLEIQKLDIQSFFHYSWKVLTDIYMNMLSGSSFKEQWKEKSSNNLIKTGNVENLLSVFQESHTLMNGYFNDKIVINKLCDYFKKATPSGVSIEKPKKIKKLLD